RAAAGGPGSRDRDASPAASGLPTERTDSSGGAPPAAGGKYKPGAFRQARQGQ
ncbi:MAG: hypothetical protein INR71_04160, partial [Terriglobus roseus]|nr:hypothetical protein [Terriglobus roseus]